MNDQSILAHGRANNPWRGRRHVALWVVVLGLLAPLGTVSAASARPQSSQVWAWGNNSFGVLGDGTTASRQLTPVRVRMPAGVRFTTISAGNSGSEYNLALDPSGRAWAWGDNGFGQLGDGTTTERHTPVRVRMPAGVRFTAVSATALHSLALDTAGKAWAWGRNEDGELGDGTTTERHTPVRVRMPAGVKFTAIAGGGHSVALDSTGRAWGWGSNFSGEVGDGTTTGRHTPVRVRMPAGVKFTAISASNDFSLALDAAGRVWGWGSNNFGSLGNGSQSIEHPTPVRARIPAGVRITSISAGVYHALALDSTGRAWAWGGNGRRQLGDDSTVIARRTPVRVHMSPGVRFTAVSAGGLHSLAITPTGQAWAWGYNILGQLGNGRVSNRRIPVRVHMPVGVRFSTISAGLFHNLALPRSRY